MSLSSASFSVWIQPPLIASFSASLTLKRPLVQLFTGHPVQGVCPSPSLFICSSLLVHSHCTLLCLLLYSFLQHLSSISSVSAHCPSNSEDSVASLQLSILPGWAEKQTGVHMFPWNFNDFHNSGVFTCQPQAAGGSGAASSALVTAALNPSQEYPLKGFQSTFLSDKSNTFSF